MRALAPYGASRGGVRQLTMSLADDWGPHGITVNCLAPGWFRTAQNQVLYENQEWVDYLVDRIPVKRPGDVHDLDGAVVFLASESSRYITGQTLLVDGGISTGAMRATVSQSEQRRPVMMLRLRTLIGIVCHSCSCIIAARARQPPASCASTSSMSRAASPRCSSRRQGSRC